MCYGRFTLRVGPRENNDLIAGFSYEMLVITAVVGGRRGHHERRVQYYAGLPQTGRRGRDGQESDHEVG